MFPEFFIFGRHVPLYTLIALGAMLLVGAVLCRRVRRLGYDDNDAIVLLLLAAVGALLGGSALYGVTHWDRLPTLFAAADIQDFFAAFSAIFGGLVFYGGLFGGFLAGFLYAHAKRLDKAAYADAAAPLIPLFHGFARIGCFCGGCCYGVASRVGFIAQNNPYVPELNGVRRFPVQLLESAGNFLIFLALNALYLRIWRPHRDGGPAAIQWLRGNLLAVYFLLYALLRFFDEFLRGDAIRGFVFGGALSTSQFISILLFAAGTVWLTAARTKTRARASIR